MTIKAERYWLISLFLGVTISSLFLLITVSPTIASLDTPPKACYADLVFVVDGSSSVGIRGWNRMMKFMKDFTKTLEIGQDLHHTSVGVVSFHETATLHIKLNAHNTVSSLHTAIDSMVYKGGITNLAAGIQMMRAQLFTSQNGDRPDARNIAIIITDGSPTTGTTQTIPEAVKSRHAGIVLVMIGIGSEISTTLLETIASTRDKKPLVYYPKDFDRLLSDTNVIMKMVCDDKILPCGPSDVALLLDSSGSVGQENWERTQKFVKDFVLNLLPFGRSGNQIGVISFSTEAEVHAHLNSHDNYGSFAKMIDDLKHRNHKTNISGAIRLMYKEVFNATHGDRPDDSYGNIALILTDGQDNVDDNQTASTAATARARGIHIIVVGIGKASDMKSLNSIVSKPRPTNMILIEDFSDLVSKAKEVFLQACTGRSPTPNIEDVDCGGDIYIVVDVGSDLSDEDWTTLRADVIHYVNLLLDDEEAPLFGRHHVKIVFMVPGQSDHPNYIMRDQTSGSLGSFNHIPRPTDKSDTAQALKKVRNRINSENNDVNRRHVVILIADGRSTLKSENTGREADKLQVRGVVIFAIGFGNEVSVTQLTAVASSPTDHFARTASNIDAITEHAVALRDSICYASAKQIWFCTFETNEEPDGTFCGATVEPQDMSSFKWLIGESGTISIDTGPRGANTGRKYAFVEASDRPWSSIEPLMTVLYVPSTDGLSGYLCLYFHYHMYGSHQGALQVLIEHAGQKSLKWTKSGDQGNQWQFAKVQLDLKLHSKILLRVTLGTGCSSDTAIDDVRLVKAHCWPDEDEI